MAASAVAVALAGTVQAQDIAGGKALRLTLGQSLQYSDNIDLVANPARDVLRSSTQVGLAYSDITRTQSFLLSSGGSYEVDTDGRTGLDDPYVRLSYGRQGANSRLDLSASYTRANFDDAFSNLALIPPDDDLDPDDPVTGIGRIEGGVRTNTDYALGFETGQHSPIGFRLDLSEQARRYSQTTDPDLFATKNRRIGVVTTFRIDPRIDLRLTARARHYTAEDTEQTKRRETSLGAGATLDIDPVTALDLSLSRQRKEVRRLLAGTTVTSGLAYEAALDRALPNGRIGLDARSEPTVNGRRTTLRATRAMTLRRDGTLSYGIGVTRTEGFSADLLFSLSYAQPLKLGSFGLELSQDGRTDEEDDTSVIVTRASAYYRAPLTPVLDWAVTASLSDVSNQSNAGESRRRINLRSDLSGQINDLSSWSAGVTFSDTRTSTALTSEEQRRYGLQLTYRREVAKEWDMVARYQHTTILSSAAADRRSNAISLGLEKTFEFRP